MDEGLSRAVREVFVRLYEEGLIYQATHRQLVPALPYRSCRTSRSSTKNQGAISGTSAIPWSVRTGV